jgi:hypothetical protein
VFKESFTLEMAVVAVAYARFRCQRPPANWSAKKPEPIASEVLVEQRTGGKAENDAHPYGHQCIPRSDNHGRRCTQQEPDSSDNRMFGVMLDHLNSPSLTSYLERPPWFFEHSYVGSNIKFTSGIAASSFANLGPDTCELYGTWKLEQEATTSSFIGSQLLNTNDWLRRLRSHWAFRMPSTRTRQTLTRG